MAKRKPKKLTKKQKATIKKHKKTIAIAILIVIILLVVVISVAYVYDKDKLYETIDKITEMFYGQESGKPVDTTPTTPNITNIEISSEGKLTWNSVGNGTEYTIKIGSNEFKTQETSYDFSQHLDEIKEGLAVEITAKLPKHKSSNKKSITINYDTNTTQYSFEYNYKYEGYYKDIDYNMSNEEIFNKLHNLINVVTAGNGSQNTSYGEAREILVKSDVAPGKDTLYGIYDNKEITANWGKGKIFDREHVWPNSKLGLKRVTNSNRNIASDPHNLRAINKSTNSSRSNRYFAAGSGSVGYTIGTNEYYPGDDHCGDVARILLYMAVRYKEVLSLVETPKDIAYKPEGAEMGKLSLLLEWHNADPVDEFELNRNEVIYQYQGNRNPFIDHPELFERVYEQIITTSLNSKQPIQTLKIIIKNLEIQKNIYLDIKQKYLF
ncbi:MAG: endonuclease I family protein [Acholeplasmataceae bacterium]